MRAIVRDLDGGGRLDVHMRGVAGILGFPGTYAVV